MLFYLRPSPSCIPSLRLAPYFGGSKSYPTRHVITSRKRNDTVIVSHSDVRTTKAEVVVGSFHVVRVSRRSCLHSLVALQCLSDLGNFVLANVRSQLTAQTNSGWITTDIVLCALTLSVSRNETLRIVVLDHQDIWQGGTGALVSKQTLELRREEGDELVMVLGHRDILPTSWLR
jgi:hypothetical protein